MGGRFRARCSRRRSSCPSPWPAPAPKHVPHLRLTCRTQTPLVKACCPLAALQDVPGETVRRAEHVYAHDPTKRARESCISQGRTEQPCCSILLLLAVRRGLARPGPRCHPGVAAATYPPHTPHPPAPLWLPCLPAALAPSEVERMKTGVHVDMGPSK